MKKADIIELLEMLNNQAHEMRKYYSAKGDEQEANEYAVEALTYRNVIYLLTDDKYAKEIKNTLMLTV